MVSLDGFIIASFAIGGGNTVSTFALLVIPAALSAVALRLSRYKG